VSDFEASDRTGASGPVGACAAVIVACVEAKSGDLNESVAFAGIDGDVFAFA